MAWETTLDPSKVVFSWGKVRKRALSQKALCSRFLDLHFWNRLKFLIDWLKRGSFRACFPMRPVFGTHVRKGVHIKESLNPSSPEDQPTPSWRATTCTKRSLREQTATQLVEERYCTKTSLSRLSPPPTHSRHNLICLHLAPHLTNTEGGFWGPGIPSNF